MMTLPSLIALPALEVAAALCTPLGNEIGAGLEASRHADRLEEITPESADTAAATKNPAMSKQKGSFIYDKKNGKFLMEWPSIADFHAWHEAKQLAHSIELIRSTVIMPNGPIWTERCMFVCLCTLSGSQYNYKQKHEQQQKIKSKKIQCPCHVVIKRYLHMQVVLGHYHSEHNHELGIPNIWYLCLSQAVQDRIKTLLLHRVHQQEIIHLFLFLFLFGVINPERSFMISMTGRPRIAVTGSLCHVRSAEWPERLSRTMSACTLRMQSQCTFGLIGSRRTM
jgi:hypothetical protein